MKFSNLFFICLLSLIYLKGFSDSAPVKYTPGGNVKPINNNDVELESELIIFNLYEDFYSVDVEYIFRNTGNKQEVLMGFPNHRSTGKIDNFTAFINGTIINTFKKELDIKYGENEENGSSMLDFSEIDLFECYKVTFDCAEKIIIKNTYTQYYREDHFDSKIPFSYILKTGALWKGKIKSVKIIINPINLPEKCDSFVILNAKKYQLNQKYIEFNNIEPTLDLEFNIPIIPGFKPYEATSSLMPCDESLYSIKNLMDGDSSTAWVEGVNGSGIGQLLKFKSNYYFNGNFYFQIDSITIINGLTKSETLFYQNNRVKKIKLIIEEEKDNESDRLIADIMDLEDKQGIQTFKFTRPILTKDITMEIMDIYKGNKYDDTAISEIKIYYKTIVR